VLSDLAVVHTDEIVEAGVPAGELAFADHQNEVAFAKHLCARGRISS
jgi:hypothetical protein